MPEPVTYGGQAVVEGVMMRGPRYFAVACRRADGTISVQREEVPKIFTRFAWARWPFLRGVFALADAMVLGMKSLVYSANLAATDEAAAPTPPMAQILMTPIYLLMGVAPARGTPSGAISGIAVTGSALMGMALGIGLFMLFPSYLAGLLRGPTAGLPGGDIWPRIAEGVVRVLIVLGYITLIGRSESIRRVFRYHGAEHQAINAFEATGRAEVEDAVAASRIHPRCGTNFILTVLLIKALVFTVIPFSPDLLIRLGSRLALLPIVGSVAYEVIRLAGRYRSVPAMQWLVMPGLWTQYLTTREPDQGMVEVAVTSLRAVLEAPGESRPADVPAQALA